MQIHDTHGHTGRYFFGIIGVLPVEGEPAVVVIASGGYLGEQFGVQRIFVVKYIIPFIAGRGIYGIVAHVAVVHIAAGMST